ncbi:hypothetical protein NQZ68_038980, partial [Dissostichus eleginoides]
DRKEGVWSLFKDRDNIKEAVQMCVLWWGFAAPSDSCQEDLSLSFRETSQNRKEEEGDGDEDGEKARWMTTASSSQNPPERRYFLKKQIDEGERNVGKILSFSQNPLCSVPTSLFVYLDSGHLRKTQSFSSVRLSLNREVFHLEMKAASQFPSM